MTFTPTEVSAVHRTAKPEDRRRRRWWVPVTAAAAVAAVAATAVATRGEGDDGAQIVDEIDGATGLAPSAARLQGIWFEDRGTGYWPDPIMARFDLEGTFSIGGVLAEDSWMNGTYETDGHRIVFRVSGGACGGGDTWTWDVGIVADGRLEAMNAGTDDDSPTDVGACYIPIGEPYNLTRVSPSSPGASRIPPGDLSVGDTISSDTTSFVELEGVWLQPESGHVLQLDQAGGYRLDDDGDLATNPDDAGHVEIGAQTLTYTTTGDTTECADGDPMVWTNARLEQGTLHATVIQDTCDHHLGAEVAFIFLDVASP